MNILYVSRLCSNKQFNKLFNLCKVKPQQQAQKFHSLMVNGLAESEDIKVIAMSDLPVSRINTEQVWWSSSSELENKIKFKYLPHLNISLIGHLITFFFAFFTALKWCWKDNNKDKYIVCDILNLTTSVAAKTAAMLFGVKTVAIVTDIPSYMQGYTKEKTSIFKFIFLKVYTSLSSFFLKRYDAYVILTEQMNEVVNPKRKPHIVIEGMVDKNMVDIPNEVNYKYQEKVIIYAGALYEKYGVKKLIDAFTKVSLDNARLWIFGSGELENQLGEYEKRDNRIKFFGVLPNNDVVEKEIKATLLVNPRPSNEEFTKYSFPSKNMEYMASGTALLTTPLPGMPNQYYNYVHIFEDESEEGICLRLNELLSQPKEVLHETGVKAKKFVIENKTNVSQAKCLIKFLNDM